MFGEILDSARTAVAEGQQETGTNAGDQNSKSATGGKPSSGGQVSSGKEQPSQAASGADVIAAAVAFLTGQAPVQQKPSAGKAADASTSSALTGAGSSASSDAAAGQTTAAQPSAGTAAPADTGAAPAQSPVGKSDEPKSGSKPAGDALATATAPASAGQYTQQAAAAASTSTTATTEVTADSASQAQAQGATQQAADPKRDQPKADATRQALTGVAAQAATTSPAASQPQAPGTAGATQNAASPTSAQQQTGTGGHSGNGSAGHPGTPGQPNAGTTGGGATSATTASAGGSPASNAFTLAAANGTGTTAGPQHTAAAAPHEFVRGAVSLQEAVDAVKATFTAANQAGVSSARISLSPESLGGIKISLSQTPDGLIARVATDHPEAALTLQQSAGDLKRSLEDSGMSLLRLDIGSSGQQGPGSFAGSAGDGSQAGSGWSAAPAQGAEDDTTSTPTEQTLELSSGSLVNVLA